MYTLPTLKIGLSDCPLIEDDIFGITVNFLPIDTTIGIAAQCCEHHNISYISHSTHIRSLVTVLSSQETGSMYGSLALVENNQQKFNKFWKLYQVNNFRINPQ